MDKRILEGIEACRPGSDDVHSPDLADVARAVERDPEARLVYERVQEWDAALLNAMEQVPLPPGLAERLIDRLNASSEPAVLRRSIAAAVQSAAVRPLCATGSASASADDTGSATGTQRKPFLGSGAGRWSRRQWVGLSALATLAAGLLIAAGLFVSRPSAEIALETMAEDWLKELDAHPAAWRGMQSPPRDFAIPASLMASPASWQPVGQYAKGIAYKLEHPKAGAAMLYVVRLSRPGLPTAPPGVPQSTTGGKAVGYWRSGGIIFVLVVPGDERNYRTFVRSAPVPLA
jgi:hypothetical protein